jgi:hypothetical protein
LRGCTLRASSPLPVLTLTGARARHDQMSLLAHGRRDPPGGARRDTSRFTSRPPGIWHADRGDIPPQRVRGLAARRSSPGAAAAGIRPAGAPAGPLPPGTWPRGARRDSGEKKSDGRERERLRGCGRGDNGVGPAHVGRCECGWAGSGTGSWISHAHLTPENPGINPKKSASIMI